MVLIRTSCAWTFGKIYVTAADLFHLQFLFHNLPRTNIFAKLKAKTRRTAKPDIEQWIGSTSLDEMESAEGSYIWHRDRVLEQWSPGLEYAHNKWLTSKTSVRVQFLQEELLSLSRRDGELTYTLYVYF